VKTLIKGNVFNCFFNFLHSACSCSTTAFQFMQYHIADVLSLIFVINICLLSYRLTKIVVTLNRLILSCVQCVKGLELGFGEGTKNCYHKQNGVKTLSTTFNHINCHINNFLNLLSLLTIDITNENHIYFYPYTLPIFNHIYCYPDSNNLTTNVTP
jgi:hypothetical protein